MKTGLDKVSLGRRTFGDRKIQSYKEINGTISRPGEVWFTKKTGRYPRGVEGLKLEGSA